MESKTPRDEGLVVPQIIRDQERCKLREKLVYTQSRPQTAVSNSHKEKEESVEALR